MKRLSGVEIAAVIVGFVALMGAAFTVYIFTKNEVKVEAISKAKQPGVENTKERISSPLAETLINSSKIGAAVEKKEELKGKAKIIEEPKVVVTDPLTTTAIKTDTAKPRMLKAEIVREKKEIKKKTIEKKSQQVLTKKKPVIERRLKQVELNQLMAHVYDLKANNVNRKACVFIRQTASSNVIEGLTDVGRLLQARGFIIAGRERVRGTVEGVKVRWPNECLTVTIGSVE
jgi:hypothetical protein